MLVGREALLRELADRLADDEPVALVGEAGIGKTALLRAAAAASGRAVFEGGGLATLSWLQFLPLRRALSEELPALDAEAAAAFVKERVGSGVLLLDDLQWADPATAETVVLLAGRVGLLAAVRRGDPQADATADRLRDAGFAVVDVPPLDETESAELVRALRPQVSAAALPRLLERSGGNPLLLQELAPGGEPSASLRLALAARLRQLDEPGREAFALLALAGRPLTPDDLGGPGAKSLLAADLAVSTPDGVDVRHGLLGEIAVEQLDEDERRRLHARLARIVADDGESARHHAAAGEGGLARAAALRAAAGTDRPGELASHLAVAARFATGADADALRVRAARALQTVDDWDGLNAVLDRLSPDDAEAQAWACLLRSRAAWTAGQPEQIRTAVSRGLELAASSGTEVEVDLLIAAARIPIFLDAEYATGRALARQALDLARQTGVALARAESIYGTALFFSDDPEWVAHVSRAVDLARADGDAATELAAALNLVAMHETAGDPAEGRRLAALFIDRCRELGVGKRETALRIALLNLDFQAGDYPAVLAGYDALQDAPLDGRSQDRIAETYCLTLIDLGRIGEAQRLLAAATEHAVADIGQNLDWTLAEAELWGGRPGEALRHVEAFLARTLFPTVRVYGEVSRACILADLERDPGDPVPEQETPGVRGAHPETRGLALRFAGDHAGAAAAFAAAAALWAPYHARGALRSRWRQGEALAAAGDREAAIEVLTAVEADLEAAGMLPLLGRVRRTLRACGVRRAAPPSARGATTLLSGRESQVLALVREGLSNREIAARLGVSRHTVVTQLASAAAKLGAAGRAQAAALAAEAG